MSKTRKRIKGDIGEEIVCRYLKEKGYRIIEQNYLKKWGEIDIIAQSFTGNILNRQQNLHFIEVKTSSANLEYVPRETEINPFERIDDRKLARMKKAIQTYISEKKVPRETNLYIDAVGVLLDENGKKAKVTILKNVIIDARQ